MLTPHLLKSKYDQALTYGEYVATASAQHAESWRAFHDTHRPDPSHTALLAGFTRRINALAISGTWCGDCVQQLPFLAHFEAANPGCVRPRFLDRDEHADLAEQLTICEGARVPVVLFLNEDFDFLSLFGDRSLSRYRTLAARHLGASCPLPGASVDHDEARATCQDWLNELERVQLLCRLSPKLRARHGD